MHWFLVIFFLSFSLEARSLFNLTEFPEESQYMEFGYQISYTKLTSQKEIGQFSNNIEPASRFMAKYGRKFSQKHLFTVEFDYHQTEANSLRSGSTAVYFDYYNGFQEPYFEYRFRLQEPSQENNLFDLFVGLRPAFMSRSVGRNGMNTWSGRTQFNVGFIHGSQIPDSPWQVQTIVMATRFSWGKEENEKASITRKFQPTHEFLAELNISYDLFENTMIYGGIGLVIYGDTRLESSSSSIRLQRGTASNVNMGLKQQLSSWIADLNLTRLKNDYFLKASNYSYDGDIESWICSLSFKKEF